MKVGALGRLFLPAALIILASCEGVTTSDIDDRVIAVITVTPPQPTVAVGSTVQLSAIATDVGGQTVSSATFVWSSFSEPVATVDSNGLVTGVAPGNAIVAARIVRVAVTAGSASVTVVAAAAAPSGDR